MWAFAKIHMSNDRGVIVHPARSDDHRHMDKRARLARITGTREVVERE